MWSRIGIVGIEHGIMKWKGRGEVACNSMDKQSNKEMNSWHDSDAPRQLRFQDPIEEIQLRTNMDTVTTGQVSFQNSLGK